MKLLLSETASGGMIGKGGGIIKEVQAKTGAVIHLSGKGEFYPGTRMQEVNVQALSEESLNTSVEHILATAMEVDGATETGDVGSVVVVPSVAAAQIIGKGGQNIKQLQAETGVKVHIEETILMAGAQEQVVTLSGPPNGVLGCLMQISHHVQELQAEPWFAGWSSHTLASGENGAANSRYGGKGCGGCGGKDKGGCCKSKGGWGKDGCDGAWGGFDGVASAWSKGGCGGCDAWGKGGSEGGAWQGGWGRDSMGKGSWSGGAGASAQLPVAFAARSAAGMGGAGLEPLKAAFQCLPAELHSAGVQGPPVAISVPAEFVSGLIGKAGAGIKEITASTGAKVQVREVEGDPTQKTVRITGPTVGIAAAYLRVVGRLAELELAANVAQGGVGKGGYAG